MINLYPAKFSSKANNRKTSRDNSNDLQFIHSGQYGIKLTHLALKFIVAKYISIIKMFSRLGLVL